MSITQIKFFSYIVLLPFLFSGCKNYNRIQNSITVSILPQKYIVQQLVGEDIPVNVLIPQGSNPATHSPTLMQIKALGNSKIYLRIGHVGFEQAWAQSISENNPNLEIIDTSVGIELITGEDHFHRDHVHKGNIDPHIWTSPKTMMIVLGNTKKALLKSFPELKDRILLNAASLEKAIDELDNEFRNNCRSFNSNKFYIFHPAYTYLARDYGLHQVSIEQHGKEPSVQWLKKIIDEGRDDNVKAIFIQEEFDQRNAELIANELNIPLIKVNPLAENWPQEMNKLLKNLNNVLH